MFLQFCQAKLLHSLWCNLNISEPDMFCVFQLLLDAVLFGVIPIVYEYEGTTAESLCAQLETVLQGRNAQYVSHVFYNLTPSSHLNQHRVQDTL